MYLELYIDEIFLLNFLLDAVLLKAVEKILMKKCRKLGITAAAFAGGIYACLFAASAAYNWQGVFFLCSPLMGFLMVLIAFKPLTLKEKIWGTIWMYFIAVFISGIWNALYDHTDFGYFLEKSKQKIVSFILFIGILLGLISIVLWLLQTGIRLLSAGRETKFYSVTLWFRGKTKELTGFLDTGNELIEPISGKPVLLAEYDSVKELLPKDWREYPMRLIPYHAVGTNQGILPAIIIDKVWLKGNEKKEELQIRKHVILAIYQGKFSAKNRYQIILHKELL